MSIQIFKVRAERTEDLTHIEALAERSFGPGRFARTAHRVREKGAPAAGLSFCAWKEDAFAGSIRFTAITVGGMKGALLLGPLMVESRWNGEGCGRALIETGLERARDAGHDLVLLVGDLPYYARFGFVTVPPGQISMPGPVDPERLLALELKDGALARFAGPVTADNSA